MTSNEPKLVKESDVVQPSDLLVLGDTIIFFQGIDTLMGLDQYNREWLYAERSAGGNYGHIDLTANRTRHGGKFVVALADGHIETLRVPQIYDVRESVLKRWNIDNKPHSELNRGHNIVK